MTCQNDNKAKESKICFGPIFVFMEASNPNEILKITIIVFEPLNS